MASFKCRVKCVEEDKPLDRVVDVEVRPGRTLTAFTLHDAATILLDDWPSTVRGEAHKKARQAILAAARGEIAVKAARVAYERAAQDASIYAGTRAMGKQRDVMREIMERFGHPKARRESAAPTSGRKRSR